MKIIKKERVVTTIKKEVKPQIIEKNEAIVSNETKTIQLENNSKHESYYVVQKGDNLSSIAKSHNISTQQLKEWNNIIDNNVKLGTQLIINNQSISENIESKIALTETKITEYIVVKGDNLGSIAKNNNTTIELLKEWNAIDNNNIQLGSKLIVAKTDVATANPKNSKFKKDEYTYSKNDNDKMYSVKRGDSLFSISKKFPGVTISDIKKWNNIKDESIHPGMKLKISG